MPLWFDILKLTVDFTSEDNPDAFGAYLGNLGRDEAKVHHKNIYTRLKEILNREPTEEELVEEIQQTITHETAHGAHDKVDPHYRHVGRRIDSDEKWAKEWLAYTLQYPDNLYERNESMLSYTGLNKDKKRMLERFQNWIDEITKDTEYDNVQGKNKLIKIHLDGKKKLHPFIDISAQELREKAHNKNWFPSPVVSRAFTSSYKDYPHSYHEAVKLYGNEHKEMIGKLNFKKEGMVDRMSRKVKYVLQGKEISPIEELESSPMFQTRLTDDQRVWYPAFVEWKKRNPAKFEELLHGEE